MKYLTCSGIKNSSNFVLGKISIRRDGITQKFKTSSCQNNAFTSAFSIHL